MTTANADRNVIDHATPDGARYLLEHDNVGVRQRFLEALAPQLDNMVDTLAACFKWVQPVMDAAAAVRTERTDLLKLFALGGLDDLVVSTRLLLGGKLAASGTVGRQAIEGAAMAMLCSTDQPLVIQQDRTKGAIRALYWQQVLKEDRRVQGQHAIRQLGWNVELLRAPQVWIEGLAACQKHFSRLSHAGIDTMMARTTFAELGSGSVEMGGHFDPKNALLYSGELSYRINLCRQLTLFMEHFRNTIPSVEPSTAAV
ncbi:MAG: hypothetical protein IOC39_26740 [Burkholderia sp.]|jgi:hypothetical protein|uniref:hypothetical protein n=1 Tax=Burkholderia sp. TaxID=36773 RepID=UPI00258AF709|nr:hypothetical protein [Burkholderia sp.]MCA3786157.1 hypothetical protein [Burkholderia sp.]MCA3798697.1 hypothetical protein [Burkholderia sp.]MCA3819424.1 hypothetical protein [Burkholderia sp.]MCA3839156.1 hypothetical protein [Burkholderia sp.]MCA3846891.1 hypothetical protein [Burkholderia sp.]